MKVKGKRIIVTGAARGIGRELTLELLKKGAFVIALDINEDALSELSGIAKDEKLQTYTVDVASNESLADFKKEYFLNNATVDGLINNAGIIQPFINVNELDMDIVNKVMNINFFGPFKLTKLFLNELMKRDCAHIVNVSSMGGFFPFPGQTIYGASKAALKLFTEGLFAELLDTNVGVTIVFPGAIATDIAKNSNVKMTLSSDSVKNYKMLSPVIAAREIISAMEKNKFQVYVGSDSKFMNFMYKMNPKKAIKMISKKMKLMK